MKEAEPVENTPESSPDMSNDNKGKPISFWVSIFLGFLLLVSAGLNLLLIVVVIGTAGSLSQPKQGFKEVTVQGSGDNKILVIPINGVISSQESGGLFSPGMSSVEKVEHRLDSASDDTDVKGIILNVNSPGGGVTASDKIHNLIKKFKEKRDDVFVLALMGDVATSGGYYVSAPADKIMAHRTTVTGSIGVIMQYLVVEGLLKKWGIEPETIIPENADHKDMGSPFKKLDQENRRIFMNVITEMYNRFLEVVKEGRNLSMEKVKKLADGRIYTGTTAKENGLVDYIGYFQDAVEKVKSEQNLDSVRVIEYQQKLGLFGSIQSYLHNAPGRNRSGIATMKNVLLGKNPPQFLYLWSARNQVRVTGSTNR